MKFRDEYKYRYILKKKKINKHGINTIRIEKDIFPKKLFNKDWKIQGFEF